jgi:hypothetical protein
MQGKRYRMVEAKPGQLKAAYGRDDCGNIDLQYAWGGKGAQKFDALVLADAIERAPVLDGKCLREVLTERGYDITTLKITVELAAQEGK